jgi:hypothetical protein
MTIWIVSGILALHAVLCVWLGLSLWRALATDESLDN